MGRPATGNSRSIIRAAIATAGPAGLTLSQLCALLPDQKRQDVNLSANSLARHGHGCKVGNGRYDPRGVRWFATAAAANAWLAANPVDAGSIRSPRNNDARIASDLEFKRRRDELELARRRSGQTPGPAVVTTRTLHTPCPTPPGRYAITQPITGGFASRRPGEYAAADAPSRWVTATLQGEQA